MRKAFFITVTAVLALSFAGNAQKAEAKSEDRKVTKRVETKTTPVPATERYVFDRTVSAGRIVREGTGEPGVKKTTTIFTYVNGKLVKERTETTITKKPSDIVVRISPAGNAAASRGGSYVAKKVLTMNASAYMANEGRMNPTSRTATGKTCEFGIIAVDPRVIPLHTLLYVEGYGFGVAEDTGGAIKGNKLDLCMNSRSEMNAWGRRQVKVHVLRTLSDKELSELGIQEGVTEKVHEPSLLAMTNAEDTITPLPMSPVETQQGGGDPASTPGRDPSEPRPATNPTPANPVTPVKPDPGSAKQVTVTRDVNVRAKPSSESTIVALLMKGDKVTLGDGSGGWYAVTTPSGTRGYVRGDSVGLKGPDSDDFPTTNPTPVPKEDPVPDKPANTRKTMVVKKDDVIVRSKASTGSNKVTTVSSGTKVTALGTEGDWVKVQLKDGSTGYIRSDMFEATSSKSETPNTRKTSKPKAHEEESPRKKTSSEKTSKKSKKSSNDDEDKPAKKSSKGGSKSSSKKNSEKKSSEKSSKKSSEGSKHKSSGKSKEESSSKKKSTNKKKKG